MKKLKLNKYIMTVINKTPQSFNTTTPRQRNFRKNIFLMKAIFNRTIIAHYLTLLYTISLLNC